MSNCISFRESNDIIILPTCCDYSKMQEARDLDGNQLVKENGEWIFVPAFLTTLRDFRHFVLTHIQPYKLVDGVKFSFKNVTEESDGFAQAFRLTVDLDGNYDSMLY